MQSDEIQIKTTKLSLYLLKSKEHEDEWFKEHHSKIVDDCTKKSITSSFLGLLYPVRVICYLDKEKIVQKGNQALKEFLSLESIQNCTESIIKEILRLVAETFPGAPVAELEAA